MVRVVLGRTLCSVCDHDDVGGDIKKVRKFQPYRTLCSIPWWEKSRRVVEGGRGR